MTLLVHCLRVGFGEASAASSVADHLFMPHKHSAVASAVRRARVVARGLICAHIAEFAMQHADKHE